MAPKKKRRNIKEVHKNRHKVATQIILFVKMPGEKKVSCVCDQGYSNTVPAKFQKKIVFSVRVPPLQNNNLPKSVI